VANTSVLMTELQRLRTGLEEEQAEKNRKKMVTFEEYINKVFDWPIPHFWLEPVRAMPKNKKLLILVPPGHRKTTTLVAYAAWALGTKYRTRIVIVSHTADYASTILNQVTDVLQSERSIQLIGKVVPDNPEYTAPLWRVDKRKIYHNAMQKEPNLISVGIEGSALGYRVDAIIADDIITPKNSYTPTMRAKISAAFWAELSKRLEPDGQIIISGSRFYKNDLYDEISNNSDWEKITLTSTPENILWPERFSKEQLEQERSANELFFRSQYLQEPISDGTALDSSWLNYYIETPPNLTYYIGVDPCEKAKEGTDFFAACVLGVSPDGVGHIIDLVEAQLSLNQQVEMVQRLAAMYKPTLVNVEEKGALYGMLVDNLKWYVRASPSNLPKHIRIQNIAEKFRQKKLLLKGAIDEGDLVPDIMSEKFRQQWEGFGGSGHDDMLDATEKAYEAYLQGGESATSFISIADDIAGDEKGDTTYARTRPYVSVHDYNPFNIQRLF